MSDHYEMKIGDLEDQVRELEEKLELVEVQRDDYRDLLDSVLKRDRLAYHEENERLHNAINNARVTIGTHGVTIFKDDWERICQST